jgi:hypothetical protein
MDVEKMNSVKGAGMKLLVLATSFLMTGCLSFYEGDITGTLVRASWGGIIFNSCEIEIQYSGQSSKTEDLSSSDKALCRELQGKLNQVITFKYKTHMVAPTLGSGREIIN